MSDLRRVNMVLRPEATKAMERLHAKRGHNMTEAVNKSLVLYDVICDYIDQGGVLHITYQDGREVRVQIL